MKPFRTSRFFGALISISIIFEITAMQPDAPLSTRAHLQAKGESHLQKDPRPADQATPRISLMFTGDINLGRCVAKETIKAGDYTHPFRFVAEKLRSADITIGSLDGTISDQSHFMPCPDSTNLIGPENMVQGLQFAGFDVITVATNHSKDCGEKGYNCKDQSFLDTMHTLSAAGIEPVGGGENLSGSRRPVILERQGIRFAFLAVNQIDERVWATENLPGTAPLSPHMIEQIKMDIAAARELADVVVVLPQWGIEYASRPEAIQRIWAQEFLNAGASLVIGNGPHIVQPMEVFQNGISYYALGNFVFDQDQKHRREGIVVKAIFNGTQLESWELEPISINYFTYQPVWAEGSEAERILKRATPIDQ
jgi:poly-gamma-glutamate capsule biosynthesis protein CapA/YwtB (metallophosphatase superfamily)